MRESKAELTDRLRREGRFDEFKKRREQLRVEGVPAKDAWQQAATEFPAPARPDFAIVPTIKWKDAEPNLRRAHDNFDWLLQAIYVKLPKNACNPYVRKLIERIRSDPSVQTEFFRLALKRMFENGDSHFVPPCPSLREIAGSKYRPSTGA
jgi:hypothetical protein